MTKSNVTRRDFIKRSAQAAAGVALGAGAVTQVAQAQQVYKSILPQTIMGANEKIYTVHIGTGGMGRSNLGFVLQRDDMEIVALCDLYKKNLERGAQMAKSKFPNVTLHHDFREMLETRANDFDAVVVATPDHWHCLCTLFAAEMKKDVYCEKPLSTTIEEGRAMIEAVRRNNIIFQGGNMQRSGAHFQEAINLVQTGYIGKVGHVEAYINDDETVDGIGMGEDDQAKWEAQGLDWDFHQGWVEHKPFNTNRWIYNFRWFLDYSGGKLTDWGAHLIDVAVWGIGKDENGQDKQPVSVSAVGGKYIVQDNRTTPDTLEVVWEYKDCLLRFSNRVYSNYVPQGYQTHGILFHGTLGTLRVDRGGYEVYPVANNGGCEPKKAGGSQLNEPHWQNFCDSIRERKDPTSTVELLHNTTRTCHMGTCSYVAGGRLHWDVGTEKFTGDDATTAKGNEWAYRVYQNGWSLKAPFKSA